MHGSYISLAVMAVGAAAAPSMPKSDMSSDPFSSFPFMSDTTAAVEDDDGMDNPIPAYMEAMQIAQSAQSGDFNSAPASSQSFQQPAQQAQQPAPTFQAPQADPAPTFQAPQANPAPSSSEAPEHHATPIFKTSEAVPPQPTQAPVIKPEVVQKPHEHHSHSIPAAITNIAPAPLSDPVPPMQMPASSSESDDMPMISEAPMVPQISEMSELPETYSSSFSTEAVFTIAPIPPKAHSAMSSMTHSVVQTPMAKPEPQVSSTHSVMMPVLPHPMPMSTHSVMMQPTPTHQVIVTMSTKARPTHSVMIHEQHMASSKASASSSATPSGSATPSASAKPANPLGPLGGMLDDVPVIGGLLGRLGL
ncbi:uncharacterized protein N7469_001409 [Penicillium citrinum]|uniref:Uncharacterized protein n=1 Tax=Penicillium citrinum TaxID=5077 RepID=A0A9W9TVK1_PENCI|nr:uncharacterized protein N7469_001409 [Penicillium citrinum]KAJ5243082.1 hypothetical protein N7469_001409 [Penicillium citrinum]